MQLRALDLHILFYSSRAVRVEPRTGLQWSPVITSSEVGRQEAVVGPAGDGWGWLGKVAGKVGEGR